MPLVPVWYQRLTLVVLRCFPSICLFILVQRTVTFRTGLSCTEWLRLHGSRRWLQPGFALLFGVVGVAVAAGGSFLMGITPWLAVVVGGVLMLLGAWMLTGRTVSFHFILKWAGKVGDPREISLTGFFLFGVAFGATSLSCTLPIFLMVVGSSVTAGDFAAGVYQFVSYILGMGSVLLVLTLGMAIVKEGVVVGMLRSFLPYVQKISALLLLSAGGYIVYYWLSSGLLLR